MLNGFKPRLYQETILATAVAANTLVVLPTGMGKTGLALLMAASRLKQFPDSHILILAPTKPLCEQHLETFKRHLDVDVVLFTGNVSPQKRKEMWNEAKIAISTPQGMENDVISGRIDLKDVSLIVFDEAHKAVGDYAYAFLGQQYQKKGRMQRVLALTASPGHQIEKIAEVCDNLGIDDVEMRDENDPDVKPYIQDVAMEWKKVEFSEELKKIHKYLKSCFARKIRAIQALGMFSDANPSMVTRTKLLKFQSRIYADVSSGQKTFETLRAMSLLAEAMKVSHAMELLESQGIYSLFHYLDKIKKDSTKSKVKAVQNLVKDADFKSAHHLTTTMYENKVEHPKIKEAKKIVLRYLSQKKSKIIVFTQYRDTADHLVEELSSLDNVDTKVSARLFVGQAKKNGTGLSQKEQKKVIDDFTDGKFNILVSTSVGEEGLDIPQVDLVLFYEPIPSAIRTVQRRGRTGRLSSGRVITLMTKGTRDEGYRWSAHHKENKMRKVMLDLKKKLGKVQKPKTLYDFESEDIKIIADTREKGSKVLKILIDRDVELDLQRLDIADYVLSSRCAVEFKTVGDFVDSLVDGRLLTQVRELKENYLRPIIMVEGTADIYAQRSVNPKAINGMIATITVSYGIPIIYTKNSNESAMIMIAMAKREQEETSRDFNPHSSKKRANIRDQQEYVISSIPGVGPGLARDLLNKFGSVKGVLEATSADLKEVEKIGDVKAKQIREVIEKEYHI